ncbi:bifunctional DNA primase/polymerase [Streptomyces coeruleorubidus]|uniref:Bifunctional DNA primase/polymerase n=1 Tax=Streptomyces coeruleorubidus TaxID=116188 RepID=A0ABZ0K8S0_STRC4|nr:bifunctional DNA primase/polymerase [Streptomyces coeruleorubidus]WOT34269.1 bifunctional DNA primase/polymerase [Streptomyces coeruleorubidus]
MPQLDGSAQLTAALDAASRGWHVFPLIPGAKRPAIRDWETRATTDRERISRCWTHAAYNVGIATGPSGLIVVDLDTPKGPDDTPGRMGRARRHRRRRRAGPALRAP